ncbi:ABC transporter substrate-binding protein [Halanaerobium praevalens]|uniref:ABC transporter substrate-binding protein n=1 Tax=Halanaerobium praevalens (strain ATCC 33744 / DSM 2228 / GSL) TaxID=572479 RepID=E3DND7_HALPG|nr:ABC transporter substrate-binding protein [Halanaerobium praevalens]ADO77556.1 ABC transporter substrate-binding protein [Halanaerobium praevalens DSM 2228]
MKKYISIFLILSCGLFLLAGCSTQSKTKKTITIAEQYGLAYAPVQIIKELNFLEQIDPDLEVEWKQLSNTTAIRESMLAGEVDIAFMAVPPFLIAKDKGMEWKIFSGLSQSPLGLMTNKKDINSLADFKAEDKIALPQPGSIQHILLSMAADRDYAKSDKFDKQLLTMNHPDAMNALLAKRDVKAHFASPPYLFLESKEKGIKKIISGQEAFGGEFTFIVGVSTEKFKEENSLLYNNFLTALSQSFKFIKTEPKKTAAILAANYDLEKSEMKRYLNWPGMKYSAEIKGLEKFMNFMDQEGYLEKSDYQKFDLIFRENLEQKDSGFQLKQENKENEK